MNIRESSINTKDKEDFKNAFNFFINERNEFTKKYELINAWYSLQSKSYGNSSKPKLSKLKTINFNHTIDIEFLKKNTDDYYDITDVELKKEIDRLVKNPLNLYRGKYYAQFLVKIINILVTKEAVDLKILNKQRKIKFPVSETNLITQLSCYAYTPQCLKTYLMRNLNIYKESNFAIN